MRNALRLRSLIDDMLDLRRLETGQARPQVETFSLDEDIQSVIEDLAPLTEEKQHRLRFDIAPGRPEARTDQRRFDLILITSCPTPSSLHHPTERSYPRTERPRKLQVSISDNGIGIAPEEQERIFTRFYQVEDSLTRHHGGIGIGLSIAKGMVEVCGGHIEASSTVGQGSTFTFTIPQDQSDSAASSHWPHPLPLSAT